MPPSCQYVWEQASIWIDCSVCREPKRAPGYLARTRLISATYLHRPGLLLSTCENCHKRGIEKSSLSLSDAGATIHYINRPRVEHKSILNKRKRRKYMPPNTCPPPPPPQHDNALRPQIWPVSLSQMCTIMSKINRAWPKSNQFWKWSACKI